MTKDSTLQRDLINYILLQITDHPENQHESFSILICDQAESQEMLRYRFPSLYKISLSDDDLASGLFRIAPGRVEFIKETKDIANSQFGKITETSIPEVVGVYHCAVRHCKENEYGAAIQIGHLIELPSFHSFSHTEDISVISARVTKIKNWAHEITPTKGDGKSMTDEYYLKRAECLVFEYGITVISKSSHEKKFDFKLSIPDVISDVKVGLEYKKGKSKLIHCSFAKRIQYVKYTFDLLSQNELGSALKSSPLKVFDAISNLFQIGSSENIPNQAIMQHATAGPASSITAKFKIGKNAALIQFMKINNKKYQIRCNDKILKMKEIDAWNICVNDNHFQISANGYYLTIENNKLALELKSTQNHFNWLILPCAKLEAKDHSTNKNKRANCSDIEQSPQKKKLRIGQ
eukprot:NODE_594_length_5604_cov_0.154950.p2 type:complete len:407 gc:universal NODE_594_length_5604_cov_0.154950:396-1616(+)